MTQHRSLRDDHEGPTQSHDARSLPVRRPEPRSGPVLVADPRVAPVRRRPDAGSLRTLALFTGVASASALATAMLPSIAPVGEAEVAMSPTPDPAIVARAPAPSVRHVTRYVVLKPGQTAPPKAHVLVRPTPTPRVTVVTRTRQSGKP